MMTPDEAKKETQRLRAAMVDRARRTLELVAEAVRAKRANVSVEIDKPSPTHWCQFTWMVVQDKNQNRTMIVDLRVSEWGNSGALAYQIGWNREFIREAKGVQPVERIVAAIIGKIDGYFAEKELRIKDEESRVRTEDALKELQVPCENDEFKFACGKAADSARACVEDDGALEVKLVVRGHERVGALLRVLREHDIVVWNKQTGGTEHV